MRRYIRPLFFLLLCAIGLMVTVPTVWQHTQHYLLQMKSKNDLNADNMSSSIVYILGQDKWLQFAIPEHSEKLRLISNADILRVADIPEDSLWDYSLNYQLLAADGRVLDDRVYHQRTRVTPYQNAEQAVYYAHHYASDRQIVLDGRIITLSLQALKQVAFIRWRLNAKHPDIMQVAIRLYAPVKISAHRVGDLWRRLNTKQQEDLAKGSVFPAEMLSEIEQINLLKHQWQVLGPIGIKGQDYQSQMLYSLQDIEVDKVELPVLLAGLQADASHPAIIPIPEQGGRVSVHLKMLDGSTLPEVIPLQLSWFGRTREQRWQQTVLWRPNKGMAYPVQGGLLEIRPLAAVVIQTKLLLATGENVDITPEPLRVKAYFTDTGVDYKIEHIGQQAMPMRIDVRRFFSPETMQQATDLLDYQWLDAQQQVVHQGRLTISAPASIYDRLKAITDLEKVSDPESYYWLLPPEVDIIRFKSAHRNITVNAYNQPLGLIKSTRIPEDAYVSLEQTVSQPSWFPLQPVNQKALAMQQQFLWIAGQYHPPEDDKALLTNNYLWTEYFPEAPYQGYFLLSPYEQDELRNEALSSVYCQLPAREKFSVQLQAPNQLQNFAPDLWFFNPQKQHLNLALAIDGRSVIKRTIKGAQTRLSLANLRAGQHLFSLSPYQGTGYWLLNNMPECNGARYLKRRIFKLQPRLRFIYQHNGIDATLSARLYSLAKAGQRTQVHVAIKALDVVSSDPKAWFSKWTFPRRTYDLRAPDGDASQLLYTSKKLNAGESLFIPINHDLPQGRYQVTLTVVSAGDAYLGLAQLLPGAYELRRFYQEVQFEH